MNHNGVIGIRTITFPGFRRRSTLSDRRRGHDQPRMAPHPLGGILSIISGLALVANPASGPLAVVWIIGAYALLFGPMMIVPAFRMRGLPGHLEKLA
jgi:uncharacterized membrane protein HdeD (DUF308 family)